MLPQNLLFYLLSLLSSPILLKTFKNVWYRKQEGRVGFPSLLRHWQMNLKIQQFCGHEHVLEWDARSQVCCLQMFTIAPFFLVFCQTLKTSTLILYCVSFFKVLFQTVMQFSLIQFFEERKWAVAILRVSRWLKIISNSDIVPFAVSHEMYSSFTCMSNSWIA